MDITVPEEIPRIRRNKIKNSLFNLFRKCKLDFPVSKSDTEQIKIEIDGNEDLAMKIAHRKMRKIERALNGIPAKIIINIYKTRGKGEVTMQTKEKFLEFSYILLKELTGTEDEQKVRDYIEGVKGNKFPNWAAIVYIEYPKLILKYGAPEYNPAAIVEDFNKNSGKNVLLEAERAIRLKEIYKKLMGLYSK